MRWAFVGLGVAWVAMHGCSRSSLSPRANGHYGVGGGGFGQGGVGDGGAAEGGAGGQAGGPGRGGAGGTTGGVTTGGGALCGDGVLDPGEECDDGNKNNFDACRTSCVKARCGDAIVDAGEQCDDGNENNSDECVLGCKKPTCGDGFSWNGIEQCDDKNTVNGDGCSATCKLENLCGNGKVDGLEECDLGVKNQDVPALEIVQGALRRAVMPYDSATDPALFYGYSSASSHTGFEVVSESRIFFHRSTTSQVVSLLMHHGIDLESSGQNQPVGAVSFAIAGLPVQTAVALADDNTNEFAKIAPTSVAGAWKFQSNSDGGVITSFPFPGNWTVTVTPTFTGGIVAWAFVERDKSLVSLNMTAALQLTAHATSAGCRANCTLPKCGDAYVDGGEVCDDGNVVSGDGCSSTCLSLK